MLRVTSDRTQRLIQTMRAFKMDHFLNGLKLQSPSNMSSVSSVISTVNSQTIQFARYTHPYAAKLSL